GPAIEVSDSSVGPGPMRVGSGRRMRSRRRVGPLPRTMSRRTFEVLDGLVVVVIANATTTLSGVLIPPWRHRAQEIGAKLRLRRGLRRNSVTVATEWRRALLGIVAQCVQAPPT